jgi:hypothetical protein
MVYESTPRGAARLSPVSRVQPGDMLQVAYVAAGKRYGVVASIDATAAVTLHLPEEPGMAAALEQRGETALPHAFELDATPGFERFVFVASDSPFTTASVVDALRAEVRQRPPGLFWTELQLSKEPR